jgi:hypothetical protein
MDKWREDVYTCCKVHVVSGVRYTWCKVRTRVHGSIIQDLNIFVIPCRYVSLRNRYRGRAPTLSYDLLGLVHFVLTITDVFCSLHIAFLVALIHRRLSRHCKHPRLPTSFRHCKISISPHLTPLHFRRLECVCLLYYVVEKYLEVVIFLLDAIGPRRRSLISASRLEQMLNSTLQVLPVRPFIVASRSRLD